MDPSSIFKIITNSTLLATRLLSEKVSNKIKFEETQYCSLVFEDVMVNTSILRVRATHVQGEPIVYKIVFGNDAGFFSVDETSGVIRVADALDREFISKHTLTIAAESFSGEVSEATVNILVGDVNDNSPTFRVHDFNAEVIEEDHLGLPREIGKVWASDPDWVDENELLYTLIGDGVDGFSGDNAYFSINPKTGQIIQHRSLDRDPPNGKSLWKLKVKVHDGQRNWVNTRINQRNLSDKNKIHKEIFSLKSEYKMEEELIKKLDKSEMENTKRFKRETKNRLIRNHFSLLLEKGAEKKFPRQSLRKGKNLERKQGSFSFNRRKMSKKDNSFNFVRDENKITHSCITINFTEIKRGNSRAKRLYLIKKKYSSNNIKMKNEFKKFFNQSFSKESDVHSTPFWLEINIDPNLEEEEECGKKLIRLLKDLDFEEIHESFDSTKVSPQFYNQTFINNQSLLKRIKRNQRDNNWASKLFLQNYFHSFLKKHLTNYNNLNYKSFPSRKLLKRVSKFRLQRNKRSTTNINKEILNNNNCNLFNSLTDPLNNKQKSQLKYLVKRIKENQGSGKNDTVHIAETVVTIAVKDINDNPPIFPSDVIHTEVLENGPVDETVAIVTAWDSDDRETSTNALLRYYLETNAVDQKTGTPVFKINSTTGEIKTAMCCLDREVIQEYQLQVVAIDGGGLKGTGTVMVLLKDVNDNSPRFTRDEWKVTINETFGVAATNDVTFDYDNSTLFEISVNDLDVSNQFLFRVVNSSGWGWQFFNIRTRGEMGELYALTPLDFENERQRQGFKFLVQVTDKGTWEDLESVESSWVYIKLRDLNDNPPVFEQRLLHIVIEEDLPPYTIFTHVKAFDEDQEENGMIDFEIIDDWGNFSINKKGEIMTNAPLDREGSTGAKGEVRIVATDRGSPPLSSTAVLLVFITDVNDCPPYIKGSRIFHIPENVQESRVGTLEANDDDNWGMGHGPPFTFELAKSNSKLVFDLFILKFFKEMDSGRGGAEIWTKVPLDRELNPEIFVLVSIKDASGLESINDVIILIDDVNDNDMHPGHKDIYLWKTKGARDDYSIGRVFVNDPDNNDSKDKLYAWQGQRIPYFTLNGSNGEIKVSSRIQEGVYSLKFQVSDFSRGQKDVPANVTLNVRIVEEKSIINSIAMTLFPISTKELFLQWTDKVSRVMPLNKLALKLEGILPSGDSVDIVSVGENKEAPLNQFTYHTHVKNTLLQNDGKSNSLNKSKKKSATIWFSVINSSGLYYNPFYLRGVLEMKKEEVESALSLNVYFNEIQTQEQVSKVTIEKSQYPKFNQSSFSSSSYSSSSQESSILSSLYSSTSSSFSSFLLGERREKSNISDPQVSFMEGVPPNKYFFQVIDVNETSVVSPFLHRVFSCPESEILPNSSVKLKQLQYKVKADPSLWKQKYLKCEKSTCLNGGKCVPTNIGSKCICPGSTQTHNCKHLSLTFSSNSLLWLNPLPSCFPLEISFKFLTTSNEGVLLYSGSFNNDKNRPSKERHHAESLSPLLLLQIVKNRLELLLEGFYGKYKLVVENDDSFVDGKWHSVEIWINKLGTKILSDFCLPKLHTSSEKKFRTSCFSRVVWKEPKTSNKYPWKVPWMVSLPLQVGGLLPSSFNHLRNEGVTKSSYVGCVHSMRINGKLTEFVDANIMKNVSPGCTMSCGGKCIPKSICLSPVRRKSSCSCISGFKGKECKERTSVATFSNNEFKKYSINFNADPYVTSLKLKIKTTSRKLVILQLKSKIQTKLILYVSDGILYLDYKRKKAYNIETLKNFRFTPNSFGFNISSEKLFNTLNLSNNQTNKNVPEWLTEKSVSLPYFSCCNGYWHEIRGWKLGNHLILEADDGDILERNRSRVMEEDNSSYLAEEKFVVDENSGVIVGNNYEEEFGQLSNLAKTLLCIDDLRLNERRIEFPRVRQENRKDSTTPDEEDLSLCYDDICWKRGCSSAEAECKSANVENSICGCKKGQTPTVLGCQAYDPCLYLPCLHGGTCSYESEGTTNCTCPPSFTGEYCQWRLNNWVERDLALPVLILGILLGVIFIGCLMCIFAIHRKRKRRKAKNSDYPLSGSLCASSDNSSNKRTSLMESQISIGVIGNKKSDSDQEKEGALMGLNALTLKIQEGYNRQIDKCSQTIEDDLREYAYEGEGSSAGSLGSAVSGLKNQEDFLEILPLTKGIKDFVDLLQDLPDGFSSLKRTSSSSGELKIKDSETSNEHNRVDQKQK